MESCIINMKLNGNILPIPLEVSSFIIFLLKTSICLIWGKQSVDFSVSQVPTIWIRKEDDQEFNSFIAFTNFTFFLIFNFAQYFIIVKFTTLIPSSFCGSWRKTFLKSFNSNLRINLILCLLLFCNNAVTIYYH